MSSDQLLRAGILTAIFLGVRFRWHARLGHAGFYVRAFLSYLVGLATSVVTDLPSSAVIVWAMAVLAILLHLTARPKVAQDLEET